MGGGVERHVGRYQRSRGGSRLYMYSTTTRIPPRQRYSSSQRRGQVGACLWAEAVSVRSNGRDDTPTEATRDSMREKVVRRVCSKYSAVKCSRVCAVRPAARAGLRGLPTHLGPRVREHQSVTTHALIAICMQSELTRPGAHRVTHARDATQVTAPYTAVQCPMN